VAPIYAAREAVDPSISSGMLAERLVAAGVKASAPIDMATVRAAVVARESVLLLGDVIMTMGAGDVNLVAQALLHGVVQ
jgi:UDP-N-acetylmuramate-alanine ligase